MIYYLSDFLSIKLGSLKNTRREIKITLKLDKNFIDEYYNFLAAISWPLGNSSLNDFKG